MGLLIADRIVLSSVAWFLDESPYWLDFSVTLEAVLWALSLAVLSAAVVGVVPALKVTGKAVRRSIERGASGQSGIRFGGIPAFFGPFGKFFGS